MNRGQMRLEARRLLTEGTADFFSDAELNDWLNEGARLMTGVSQQYQALLQLTPIVRSGTEYRQEYELPEDVDEIFGVSIFNSSQVLDLEHKDHRLIQVGVAMNTLPAYWYHKSYVTQLVEHTSSGLVIDDFEDKKPRQVLGIFPKPTTTAQLLYVHYYSRHFNLETDADSPVVPPEYHRGIVWYAVSMGRDKDDDEALADRAMKKFQDFSGELKAKMIFRASQTGFPTVKVKDDDYAELLNFNVYADEE